MQIYRKEAEEDGERREGGRQRREGGRERVRGGREGAAAPRGLGLDSCPCTYHYLHSGGRPSLPTRAPLPLPNKKTHRLFVPTPLTTLVPGHHTRTYAIPSYTFARYPNTLHIPAYVYHETDPLALRTHPTDCPRARPSYPDSSHTQLYICRVP